MRDFHGRSIAAALLVVAALSGCAQSPTAALDDPGDAATMRQALRPPMAPRALARPQLVACAWMPAASATSIIGVEGGSLEVAGHRVRVPAGSVSRPTRFTATSPAGPFMSVRLEAEGFEASGAGPIVQVSLSYDRCRQRGATPRTLRVVEMGGNGDPEIVVSEPLELHTAGDPPDGIVEFVVARLGTYAVAY